MRCQHRLTAAAAVQLIFCFRGLGWRRAGVADGNPFFRSANTRVRVCDKAESDAFLHDRDALSGSEFGAAALACSRYSHSRHKPTSRYGSMMIADRGPSYIRNAHRNHRRHHGRRPAIRLRVSIFWRDLSRGATLPRPTFASMKRKTANIGIRVEPELVEKIDAWCARQRVLPSRSAAIVYMLAHFLKHDSP